MDQARVLVVDDEPNVGRFLQHALKASGYSVSVSASVSEAWELIEGAHFDVAVIDKTMPGESGMVLLDRLQSSKHALAAVLLTGEVSPTAIDQALAAGAVDYLAKPIVSTEHLVRRLRSVLDRRLTQLFFDVMFSDLTKALWAGTGSSTKFCKLSRSVLTLKRDLGKRPACLLMDDDKSRRDSRVHTLYGKGILSRGVSPEECAELARATHPPLVAAVSLESKAALKTMHRLHLSHPNLLFFVHADTISVRDALRAVDKGATDYALVRNEGVSICAKRISRLVSQARRHALYLGMATLLHSAVRETRPDLAGDILFPPSGDL